MTEPTLVDELGPVISVQEQIVRGAEAQFAPEVDALIKEQCQDPQRISSLLENLLNFCFDDRMLRLFKRLCRYYFPSDQEMITRYVYAYRDMYEDDKPEPDNESSASVST